MVENRNIDKKSSRFLSVKSLIGMHKYSIEQNLQEKHLLHNRMLNINQVFI